MQVMIRIKCRGSKVRFETSKRGESRDNVREQNIGNQILDIVNTTLREIMQRGGGNWTEEVKE